MGGDHQQDGDQQQKVPHRDLRRAERRQGMRAFLLVAPLLFFVLAVFVYPIGTVLLRAVASPEFPEEMPRTSQVLSAWDVNQALPGQAWEALALDLADLKERKTVGKVANALNVEYAGARSLVSATVRKADTFTPPWRDALIEANAGWEKPEIWLAMKSLSSSITARFFLAAVDMRADPSAGISLQPEDRRIYVSIFLRTFMIGAVVTFWCLLLGYPVAYLLASLPLRYSNLLMILVLLPFWTSLLVRTTAWIVLLQNQGVVNSLLVWGGLVADGARVELVFNRTGTIIAMTHILLPFMILPLYSVMKTIPPSYMRAARSLGANQFTAFRRIYVPQTAAGIMAGSLLVFILALGYYITPALVGGESGTLISNMIAFHIQKTLNWGLAAALSAILLVCVLVLYWAYSRLARADGLRLS